MWLLDTWSRSKPLEIEDSCCSVPYHPLQEREREAKDLRRMAYANGFFFCVYYGADLMVLVGY